MKLTDFFPLVGGDLERTLARFPNEPMILRFLRKFPADSSFDGLCQALSSNDLCGAFRAAHTLKGTAANLGLDGLAEAASRLTEALRGADAPPPQNLLRAVELQYQTAVGLIAQLDD